MKPFKPENYNSLSAYLIADEAESLVQQLKAVFDAVELRRFMREDGTIAHLELKIDDTVLMLSESTEEYQATKIILHLYVDDVMKVFNRAIENGCVLIEEPVVKPGESDKRGSFYDVAGNFWSVSTQME